MAGVLSGSVTGTARNALPHIRREFVRSFLLKNVDMCIESYMDFMDKSSRAVAWIAIFLAIAVLIIPAVGRIWGW